MQPHHLLDEISRLRDQLIRSSKEVVEIAIMRAVIVAAVPWAITVVEMVMMAQTWTVCDLHTLS